MKDNTLVMIPGPTPVTSSIRAQMGREVQAFGDWRFVKDYKELIDDLGQLFGCDGKTFVVAGGGTCGMEMAVANSTKNGDHVLVVTHGFFGDRFTEICTRKGLNVDVLQSEWGKVVEIAVIEEKLQEKNYRAIMVTHVDTSTGVVADVAAIGEMMKKFPDTIHIVDGVCATAAHYVNLKEMNIDILLTGSQKAFGVPPGLFMVWANQKALKRREMLGTIPEYYVDFHKWIPVMDDPLKYFATPAVNLVWALKEAVAIIKKEGLKAREQRHYKHARAMQKALEALGFSILAEESCRAITLSNVIYPEGIDDGVFRNKLLEEGIIVAGGLGAYAGKMFRLGHMGNIETNDLVAALSTIERALSSADKLKEHGLGVGTYLAEIAK